MARKLHAERMPGESRWTPPSDENHSPSDRMPIEVHPLVVERLVGFLHRPEMRAVGYSEFIDRAITVAEGQIEADRIMAETRAADRMIAEIEGEG